METLSAIWVAQYYIAGQNMVLMDYIKTTLSTCSENNVKSKILFDI